MSRTDQYAPYGITLLRVSLGILFLSHGLLKLLVYTPAGTVGFFESLGFPGFFAYLTILAEIGGGTFLIAGVYTRITSLALLPVVIGASFVHLPNGWVFSAEGGGWEFPVYLITTVAAQAVLGSGPLALKAPRLPVLPQALAS
ncbi:DoxX family protein [Maricaulis sp. D1M11]|uniref:DoxX family protein n=1 Tax=Maricaulis sp. D1M11 TaxID=3076117 RepID=UPI0039B66205